MEKTYFVQRKTMSGIADEVRELSGKGTMLNPEQMTTELDSANTAVDDQADVINEIKEILANKRIPEDGLEGADEYVDFYDYDGTLLHRFTVLEIQGMTELPPLPQHEGLICQGWNWTLEQLKEENKSTIVAPYYYTDDNTLRLYITIPYDNFAMNMISMVNTFGNPVNIEWGDGSVDTVTTSSRVVHTYTNEGKYCIRIKKNTTYVANLSGYHAMLFGVGNSSDKSANGILDAVELPDKIGTLNYFNGCTNLKTITVPSSFSTGEICYENCKQLKLSIFTGPYRDVQSNSYDCIVSCTPYVDTIGRNSFNGVKRVELPRFSRSEYSQGGYIQATDPNVLAGISSKRIDIRKYIFSTNGTISSDDAKIEYVHCSNIPDQFLNSNKYLKEVVIEDSTKIADNAFSASTVEKITFINCEIKHLGPVFNSTFRLTNVDLPNGLETMLSTFNNCRYLEHVNIPDSVNEIGGSTFYNCKNLSNVVLPKNLKVIGDNAFYGCGEIDEIVLPELLTQIGKNAFIGTSIREFTIPKNVESLYINAFDASKPCVIKFTEHTFIPTMMAYDSTFVGTGVKIMVPAALYDEWIKATNWVVVSSLIVPV